MSELSTLPPVASDTEAAPAPKPIYGGLALLGGLSVVATIRRRRAAAC